MQLREKINIIYQQSRRTYGSPRMHAQLVSEGEVACVNTIAKRMKGAGIRVKPTKAFLPRTTESDPSHRAHSNVLDRQFD